MKLNILTISYIIAGIMFGTSALAADKLEAEAAQYRNCTVVNDAMYSGGKALQLTETNAKITFDVSLENQAKYTIYVAGNGIGGDKVVNCCVNGGNGSFHLNDYNETEVGTFFMKEGSNKVEITPSWTWFVVDYIRVESSSTSLVFDISTTPVDKDATEAAKKMYGFLLENFGTKTISGMMTGDMSSANGDVTKHDDMKAVYKASGKYPALVGFDFMNATGKDENNSWMKDYTRAAVNLAKDTYKRGGLPAFTWHWRDPSRNTGEFYTDKNNVKASQAMNSDGTWNTQSTLYKNIIKDIDHVADFFLEMQKEGMACVFRPLHEASGGWFWWGREGTVSFIKLYQLIYDEMVNVKGVHNVIWIWNAGTEDKDWNPGTEFYDIVSADIYNSAYDYSSCYPTFDKLKALTQGKKIVALSENGPIPDIDKMADEEAMWSWWMPWYQTWGGNFANQTSNAEWKKCMEDPRVITLEDLSEGWDAYSGISHTHTAKTCHMTFDMNGRRLQRPCQGHVCIKDGKKVINTK